MQTSQPVRIPSASSKSRCSELASSRSARHLCGTPPVGTVGCQYVGGVTPPVDRRQSQASISIGDAEQRSLHRTPSTARASADCATATRGLAATRTVASSAPTFFGFQLGGQPPRRQPQASRRSPQVMEAPRESIEDSDGSLRQHIVPQLTPAAAAIESALGTSRPESPSAFPSLRLSSSPSAPGVCERTSQSARDRAASLLRALQAKHPVLRDPVVVRAFNASLEAVGDAESFGHPVVITSLHTAATVAELGMDAHTAAGAMLLGASGVLAAPRFEALVSSFPDDVAATVRHAQRMGDIVELEGATAASEALRGVLMAMADVRACVLRMSLSLQLLRQLQSRAPGDRGAFARACRDILVPLASRIGLSSLKSEMEDLCFYHLEPETHASLRSRFHTAARRDALQTALDMTQAALTEAGVPLQDISGRVKSLQGIHRKVASKGIPPEAVLDAQALRVIVPTKEDCYAALRVVQRAFDPVAGHAKVKDYIREPKANGYRSLHAYVEVPGGTPVEVQIRTMDMHLVSEYGAAAHWRYKERLGQDSLAGCASKMVAYAKYILSWELEVHDAKCKPRHSESQGGDAVRSHASACVFPKHDVDCNRHDERFCGSLEDLRDTACEYCGATHAVLVDRRGRIITLEVKPGETLADVISRRIGAPLDGMAFEINGRRVHNITSASVSTGDLVREVLPETRDDAQRLAERFQVNISLSPYGVSQVSISRPSAPAPAPLPAVSVPKGLPQRAPSELFVAAGPRGTPPAGVAPTALGAGAAPNPGASPVTRPPAWRWDAEVAPLSPGPGVAPRRALGSRRGSEASSSERAGSSGSHHPVVIGFGDAARVMGSDNDDRPGRMLACSPQMVGV